MNKTFIIAEAGVNHNGKIELAYQLIDVAAEAGADAVKFQTIVPEKLVSKFADKAENQICLPLIYKGFELSKELRIDILIEKSIILEMKSSEKMAPIYEAQIISYLKLAKKKLGFLINFKVPLMKDGFRRFVNGF